MATQEAKNKFRGSDAAVGGSKRSWTLQSKQNPTGKKNNSSPARTEDTALTELGHVSSGNLAPWDIADERVSESSPGRKVEELSAV